MIRMENLPPAPLLVRSWNVFHGNAHPSDRRSRLQTMIRLASADRPDVLCLQELPLWALPRIARWSGMSARWAVTREPWLPAWLGGGRIGGLVTRLNNGLLRSAISGQANAILLAPDLVPLAHHVLRIDVGRREPRFCHAVQTERIVVANLHATNDFRDPSIPAAEIARAQGFVTDLAGALPCVLAGDFNLRAGQVPDRAGWSALGSGIDHVLVRGLATTALETWPEERRRHNGLVLSDHAPVEVTVG